MNIIEAKHLTKSYANHKALDELNLELPENTIYGLLGPNGAGKTSLIRILTHILTPDTGEVFFRGASLHLKHAAKIGYLPEERGLYKKMKVEEQLVYLTQLKGFTKTDAKIKVQYWLGKMDLQDWKSRYLDELSKGMQQKVQFIAAVVHQPELLILDEPFSGFDPINSQIITDEILSLKAQGCTILFSTHRMDTVEALCDHFALVHKGKNILHGATQVVKENFKKNEFRIEGTGSMPLHPHSFQLQWQKKGFKENYLYAVVKALPGITANEILAELMTTTQIVSFQEVLPSINEIFISEVSK